MGHFLEDIDGRLGQARGVVLVRVGRFGVSMIMRVIVFVMVGVMMGGIVIMTVVVGMGMFVIITMLALVTMLVTIPMVVLMLVGAMV